MVYIRSLPISLEEPATCVLSGCSCRSWAEQGERRGMESPRAWTAFGPGRETCRKAKMLKMG